MKSSEYDISTIANFIDWFSPNEDVKLKLQISLNNISKDFDELRRIKTAPIHRIDYNSHGVVNYDNLPKGSGSICVVEHKDL